MPDLIARSVKIKNCIFKKEKGIYKKKVGKGKENSVLFLSLAFSNSGTSLLIYLVKDTKEVLTDKGYR